MAKNTFSGATMSQGTVSTYYPNNSNFDHFIFQQVIPDTSGPDNNYTLIAFAVLKTGLPVPLSPLTPSNVTYPEHGHVAFANLKLDKTGLDALYSRVVTSNLTVNPTSTYPGGYVAYTAYADSAADVTNNYPVNPSPPA